MPVQLNGRTADMEAICAIAAERQLFIVEDSCQALGSKFRGRCAGPSAWRAVSASIRPKRSDASEMAVQS